MREIDCDLVVVGAGVAGWVAACRARELGLDVAIVEADEEYVSGGNGRLSGGWFHAAYRSPDWAPDKLREEVLRITENTADAEVVDAWTCNVGRAYRYLGTLGARFGPIPEAALHYQQNVLQPSTYGVEMGRRWRTGAPYALFEAAHRRFSAADGRFVGGFRGTELIEVASSVRGIVSSTGAAIRARAVLLCDGGFQGNPELVARHITNCYTLRGSASDRGDALTMATAVGAAVTDLAPFYGHLLSRDSVTNDLLWPEPALAQLLERGIIVGSDGRRFIDEQLGDVLAANQLAWSSQAGSSWCVVTEPTWARNGTIGRFPPNPTLEAHGATIIRARDAPELSAALGMPLDALLTSVARLPIAEVPSGLVAIPVIAGITFAMGGIHVDGGGRVRSSRDGVIGGLYAAGGAMGGLQGGPSAGYAGGWSEAATFGLLAAESVAVDLGQHPVAAAQTAHASER
ncbi:MAG TPA: FAD-dependent oxidoreductase [Nocardioidaceae bacterium]|nr:FAD-dependent oxidoreductase [Nocardioidaceae bacterium]